MYKYKDPTTHLPTGNVAKVMFYPTMAIPTTMPRLLPTMATPRLPPTCPMPGVARAEGYARTTTCLSEGTAREF